MSREIDERVVAMYFDNRNFESGAQQTIKTLDELKKSMSFEGIGKGFEAFEQVGKKLNLDKITQSATKLKTVFNGVGTAIKKAFNLGPIDNIYHALDNFKNKYFDKVLGFDIADKLVHSVESAFRGLTIQPITAGWNQYENTMDSVKTIMSSTGESIETVKNKLGEMTDYANKTIYSLNDMTSNLGKFTNNGVKLNDATNAMIGLANATADAGQGAQQASMAMYNVSQAIGVGKMTTIDWKSLENANIATRKLKQTFIDAAVAHGTLTEKVEKDAKTGKDVVKYYTKAEKGAKAMEVSVENFRETLSKGWLDKAAMLDTFSIFSGQLTADEIAALGYSKEESERLYKIGQEAMKAAQEVRTFSKMMDALKEGVQSTWAQSFEYIFGDMEEGTKLWTAVNEKIEGILSASAEGRNNILLAWRGMMKDENGNVRKIQEIYTRRREMLTYDVRHGYISAAEYQKRIKELDETLGNTSLWTDYREVAIQAFFDIFDAVKDVAGTVGEAWTNVFGSFTGETLRKVTQAVADFAANLNRWLTEDLGKGETRLSKIRRAFEGFFSVIKTGYTVFRSMLEVAFKFIKPLIDPVLDLLAKIGDFFNLKQAKNLGDIIKTLTGRFGELWNKLSGLGWKGIFDKIGGWLGDLWKKIKSGVSTWLTENGLEGVIEWFGSIRDKFKEGIEAVKTWWNGEENGIRIFFEKIWTAVTSLFTPKKVVGKNGEVTDEDSPIVSFFKGIIGGVTEAYNKLTEWWNTEENVIRGFFEGIWNAVSDFFTDGTNDDGTVKDAPVVVFFNSIADWVSTTWESIKSGIVSWWNDGENDVVKTLTTAWNWVTGLFTSKKGEDGTIEDAPVIKFFNSIWTWVTGTWESIRSGVVSWWNDGENDVVKTLTTAWNWVTGLFTSKKGEDGTIEDAPVIKFFNSIWTWITGTWESIRSGVVSWWNDGENDVVKTLTTAWNWVTGLFTENKETGEKAPIVKFFDQLVSDLETTWKNIKKWWEDEDGLAAGIRGVFTGIWDAVSGAFTVDEKTGEIPIVGFMKNLFEGLKKVWDDVVGWPGWAAIANFVTDTWGWILGLFRGEETSTGGAEVSEVTKEATGIAQKLEETANAFESIAKEGEDAEKKTSWFDTISDFFGGIFTSLSEAVTNLGSVPEVTWILDSITKVLDIIRVIVTTVINQLHRMITFDYKDENGQLRVIQLLTDIFSTIGVIGTVILSKVGQAKKLRNLATISEAASGFNNLGIQILEIAAAIGVIAFAIEKLGALPLEQLVQGEVAVLVLGAAIGTIMGIIANLKNSGINKEPEKAWERVLGKLISWAGMAGTLLVVMEKLPLVIDAIAKAKQTTKDFSGADVFDTLKGVILTLGGAMLALALVEKIAPQGLNPVAAIKTVASVMAAILIAGTVILGSGGLLSLITNPGEIKENMKNVAAFLEGLGDAVNALFRGLLGVSHAEDLQAAHAERTMNNTKELMTLLSGLTNGLDMSQMTSMIQMTDTLTQLAKMSEGMDTTNLVHLSSHIQYLIGGLTQLARAFVGFEQFNEETNRFDWFEPMFKRGSDNWQGILDGFDLIKTFWDSINPSTDYLGLTTGQLTSRLENLLDPGTVDTIINGMNNIIDKAGGLHDASGIEFDGFAIVKRFYESVADVWNASDTNPDLPKFNGQPIVNSILDSLVVGDSAIKFAVKNMVQSGIDLLDKEGGNYDLSNLGILGNWSQYLQLPDMTELTGGMNSAVDEVTKQMDDKLGDTTKTVTDGIKLKINGVSVTDSETFLNSVRTEIDNLQHILDESPDDYSISIRPILAMDDFSTEFQKVRDAVSGEVPLAINGIVSLREQSLPINDTNIVSELQAIKSELALTRENMQISIDNLETGLGFRIIGLGNDIARMKLYLDKNLMVGGIIRGIDSGLYRSSKNSEKTGVSVFPIVNPVLDGEP